MRSSRPIRVARGHDGRAWAQALADPAWPDRARPLKTDAEASVVGLTMLGRPVVVKTWRLAQPRRRLQALLGRTPAMRHWHAAQLLIAAGLPTARCFAVIRGRDALGPCEWLVMERIPGRTLLAHLARTDWPVPAQHRLADAIGRQIACLAAAGLLNRDHKPSNIVLTSPANPPTLIDCLGIRRTRRTAHALTRMLAMLVIEPHGCGLHIRRSLRMRCLRAAIGLDARLPRSLRHRTLRRWMTRIDRRIARHGDPRPAVDPLAFPDAG